MTSNETVDLFVRDLYGKQFRVVLELVESDGSVSIRSNFKDNMYTFSGENYFEALINLRAFLEKDGFQIICNCSCKTIYPSPMQLSMGTGRIAYKLYLGVQAKTENIVDIFDVEENLECVSVAKQFEFYQKWIESLQH